MTATVNTEFSDALVRYEPDLYKPFPEGVTAEAVPFPKGGPQHPVWGDLTDQFTDTKHALFALSNGDHVITSIIPADVAQKYLDEGRGEYHAGGEILTWYADADGLIDDSRSEFVVALDSMLKGVNIIAKSAGEVFGTDSPTEALKALGAVIV